MALPLAAMRYQSTPTILAALALVSCARSTQSVDASVRDTMVAPDHAPATDAPAACADAMCAGRCVDLATAATNCGACGHDCTALVGVDPLRVACAAGRCVVPPGACLPHRGHCTARPDDGCETDLASTAHCGACATACSGATPRCVPFADGTAGCDAPCPSATPLACGALCVDPASDLAHCGACATSCSVPSHGRATCAAGACGVVCDPGFVAAGARCDVRVPRPIGPLSTARVTSRRPTLRWQLAPGTDGARVELCATRACTRVLATLDATGGSVRPGADLPTGVVFWRVHGAIGATVGAASSPVWQFTVGARDRGVDTTLTGMWDVDGDGYSDIVLVGAANACLVVYAGGPSGPSATPRALHVLSAGFWTLASSSDVDGDGFGDVLASSQSDPPVWFAGSSTGLPLDPAMSYGAGVVGRVVALGDANGDGFGDVAGEAGEGGLSVPLFFGSAAGFGAVPDGAVDPGDPSTGFSDVAIAGPGDMNGDGFADLAVASAGDAVWFYAGSPTGPGATPSWSRTLGIGRASQLVGVGDVNGDGYGDVLASTLGPMGTGSVQLITGSATGPVLGAPGVPASPSSGDFGSQIAWAGDVDRDGYDDVLISTYPATGVWLFRGSPGGLVNTPAATLTPPSSYMGLVAQGVGDVDGDGFDDVVATPPYWSTSAPDAVPWFYRGSATGLATTGVALAPLPGCTASADARRWRRAPFALALAESLR